MSAIAADTAPGHVTGFGSKPYRSYVLGALLLVYVLNFVDRGILSVVAPQLKPELGISDGAFGLLTGFGFALLYTIVGIPLAQVAETRHRVWIMTVCVALWSLMTALCGLAQEVVIGGAVIGGFWILLACRVGVGIGEAGCTPPASSLIANYHPPHARSTALGFYGMGVTLGSVLANMIGGPVTDAYGWRMAFLVVGLPGLLVALLLKLTVKEPPRGYSDPPGYVRQARPRFADGIAELMRKPSYWSMTAAATVCAFSGYGIASFQSLYNNRSFSLTAGEAALWINAPAAAASALGTLATGWLAEKLIRRSPTAIAWLPGVGLLLSVPFYIVAFTTPNLVLCGLCLCIGGAVKYGYVTAQYAISQGVVSPQKRAVSTAVMLFVVNLLGYGLGPLFIGMLSDGFFAAQVAAAGAADLTRAACEAGGLEVARAQVCASANPESLRLAMLFTSLLYAAAGGLFLLTCRWLQRDSASPAAA